MHKSIICNVNNINKNKKINNKTNDNNVLLKKFSIKIYYAILTSHL